MSRIDPMQKPKVVVICENSQVADPPDDSVRFISTGTIRKVSEAIPHCLAVFRQAARLRRTWAFDVIHAYGMYPNGCVASWLAVRYSVPVIITEPVMWNSALIDRPRWLRRAVRAARLSTFHLAANATIRDSVASYAGESEKLRIIPQDLGDLYAQAIDRYSWRKQLVAR